MLTSRYMSSVKNLPAIMKKIVDGSAPTKFTTTHLKELGFKSSNDLGVIPLLKELKFLAPDGTPLQRYHEYRDHSRSGAVLAEALREAYADLFLVNEKLSEKDREAIIGRFKSVHNVKDVIADCQTRTFLALLKLADMDHRPHPQKESHKNTAGVTDLQNVAKESSAKIPTEFLGGFHYNIEIHLPASKDVEVFNAIFKSLKEHLIG